MKNLILTFALLVSTVAFGGDPDPSTPWSKLSRMHNIIFEMPQFAMSSGWFMRAPSVCVDGDKLRSKLPKQECISWSGRDNCDEYTSFYPSIAIEGTKERCVSWSGRDNCDEWEQYDYKIPTSYDIPVYEREGGSRDDDFMDNYVTRRPLFVKNYTITSCE